MVSQPLRIQRALPARRPGRSGGWFADADGRLHAMTFTIPELSFVVLIGVSGSGKSTFARKHFKPTEILSSDYCRGLVSDDENSQAATKDAFEVFNSLPASDSRPENSPWWMRQTCNRNPANHSSQLRASFIACRWRSFWICRSAWRTTVTRRALTGISARMSSASNRSNCIAHCADLEREGFRHVHVLQIIGGSRIRCHRTPAFVE